MINKCRYNVLWMYFYYQTTDNQKTRPRLTTKEREKPVNSISIIMSIYLCPIENISIINIENVYIYISPSNVQYIQRQSRGLYD